MSSSHDIFIRHGQPVAKLVSDISAACGAPLRIAPSESIDYSASLGYAAVEVELSHEYENDLGIPFEEYNSVITVRDFEGDLARQEQLATQIYRNLAELQTYSLALVRDLQKVLASTSPPR